MHHIEGSLFALLRSDYRMLVDDRRMCNQSSVKMENREQRIGYDHWEAKVTDHRGVGKDRVYTVVETDIKPILRPNNKMIEDRRQM